MGRWVGGYEGSWGEGWRKGSARELNEKLMLLLTSVVTDTFSVENVMNMRDTREADGENVRRAASSNK